VVALNYSTMHRMDITTLVSPAYKEIRLNKGLLIARLLYVGAVFLSEEGAPVCPNGSPACQPLASRFRGKTCVCLPARFDSQTSDRTGKSTLK
jgi:hypothetical protein